MDVEEARNGEPCIETGRVREILWLKGRERIRIFVGEV